MWASLTGFGIEGEPGTGGAADTIAQALSGVMLTGGEESEPPIRLGAPLGDTITPLCLIIGILSALEHVRFTGVGERVDASMVGALTALVAIEPFDLLKSMGVPYRTGTTMARLGTFGLYQCSDGYVAVTAGGAPGGRLVPGDGQTRSWVRTHAFVVQPGQKIIERSPRKSRNGRER